MNTLSFGIKDDVTKERDYTLSQSFDNQSINSYKKATTDFEELVKTTNIAFQADSGFINSGLRFFNMGIESIKLKDVKVKLVEYSPINDRDVKTIQIVNLGEIEVPPSDENFPYTSLPIQIKNLETDKILAIQQKGNLIKVIVESYKMVFHNNEILPQTLAYNLKKKCFRLNIIDQYGFYARYDIPTKIDQKKDITLADALKVTGNNPLEIGVCNQTQEHQTYYYIKAYNGATSEFCDWGVPSKYSNNDLHKSAWIVVSQRSDGTSLSLTDTVPPNSDITVIYLSKQSVWNKLWEQTYDTTIKYGDNAFQDGEYYFQHIYLPPLVPALVKNGTAKKIFNKNKQMADKFHSVNRNHSPEIIADKSFIISPGNKIELEIIGLSSPLTTEVNNLTIPIGAGLRDTVTIKSIPVKYQIMTPDNIDEYGIWFQLGKDEKKYTLTEMLSHSNNPVLERLPNGAMHLSFEPNLSILSKDKTLYNLLVIPSIKTIELGVQANRTDGMGHITKMADFFSEKIKELRKGTIVVRIYQHPALI